MKNNKKLYKPNDEKRSWADPIPPETPWRSEFGRDYSRVIHSASFRRLQGKTQVFPGHESDFFRNRLTHSLEVAQIAEGIAERINHLSLNTDIEDIDTKLCSVAGLLHDIGHPPFGHNGEKALNDCMREYGGFEGNAQTLRIITYLEKKHKNMNDRPVGFNLTYRTIASIFKYDNLIPDKTNPKEKIKKGYYRTEKPIVEEMKKNLLNTKLLPDGLKFKTIECQIMDLADDIAYSTFDLEDSFKAGFLTPLSMLAAPKKILNKVANKVNEHYKNNDCTCDDIQTVLNDLFIEIIEMFSQNSEEEPNDGTSIDEKKEFQLFKTNYILTEGYRSSELLAKTGYHRTRFTSHLVKNLINNVHFEYNDEYPLFSKVLMDKDTELRMLTLKFFTHETIINSPKIRLAEFRGYEIVKTIFETLSNENGSSLLPDDVAETFHSLIHTPCKMRVICDFIAGMTDRYAIEFYGRIKSDNPQSMFKPI